MKNDLMEQVFLYQDNKSLYSDDEREQIKKSLREQMNSRLQELSKIYIKAIDKINNL